MTLQSKSRAVGYLGTSSQATYQGKRKLDPKDFVTVQDRRYRIPGVKGSQVTASENHPFPPKGGMEDVGGPFKSTRYHVEGNASTFGGLDKWKAANTNLYTEYIGNFVYGLYPSYNSNAAVPVFPTPNNSTESELEAIGASAIAKCRPTASAVDISTALGELRKEGLPSVIGSQTWRDRTLRARNAGSEYLNVEFGWKPLIAEVLNLGTAAITSRDILSQYRRDEGRVVRRRYSFPDIVENGSASQVTTSRYPIGTDITGWPNMISPPSATPGVVHRTSEKTTRRWFSGAFVYGGTPGFVPESPIGDIASEADKLFGISLTPDVLWNLSPWSWAADWFTNTGDVLSTMSDMVSQGLVMRYGYMMEHSIHKYQFSHTGCRMFGRSVSVAPIRFVCETKLRYPANPFGFGITWDGLSSSQIAILAALGISRS